MLPTRNLKGDLKPLENMVNAARKIAALEEKLEEN